MKGLRLIIHILHDFLILEPPYRGQVCTETNSIEHHLYFEQRQNLWIDDRTICDIRDTIEKNVKAEAEYQAREILTKLKWRQCLAGFHFVVPFILVAVMVCFFYGIVLCPFILKIYF